MRELETAVFLENHTVYFATIKTFAAFIFRKIPSTKINEKKANSLYGGGHLMRIYERSTFGIFQPYSLSVFILQRYLRKCRLSILKSR